MRKHGMNETANSFSTNVCKQEAVAADMIKMIVTDIDGTLLPEASPTPSPEVSEVIGELLDLGIRVVLASGRPYSSLRNLFPTLREKLTYLCSNGSVVMEGEEPLQAVPIGDEQEIMRALTFARGRGQAWHIDSWSKSYTETDDQAYLDMVTGVGVEIEKVENVQALGIPITKLSIVYPDGPDPHFHDADIESYKDTFSVAPAGLVFMDFNKKGVSKGSAVQHLCETYGIGPDEYMVFGDAMNDLSMLAPARNSWCSVRSVEEVKAACAHVFDPPEEGGVLGILQELAAELREPHD